MSHSNYSRRLFFFFFPLIPVICQQFLADCLGVLIPDNGWKELQVQWGEQTYFFLICEPASVTHASIAVSRTGVQVLNLTNEEY